MTITLSALARESLLEIIDYYEIQAGEDLANSIEDRIKRQIYGLDGFEMSVPESEIYPGTRKLVISKLPYVAFIRELRSGTWEVVDIVHTSRKIPK